MIKEKNARVQPHFLQEEVQEPPEAPSPGAEFGLSGLGGARAGGTCQGISPACAGCSRALPVRPCLELKKNPKKQFKLISSAKYTQQGLRVKKHLWPWVKRVSSARFFRGREFITTQRMAQAPGHEHSGKGEKGRCGGENPHFDTVC